MRTPDLACLLLYRSIDKSGVEAAPGFVCFLSAEDISGSNVTGVRQDEQIFAEDTVSAIIDLPMR